MWSSTISELHGHSLVFVDEMGTHTSLAPLYGYSPRGQRTFFKVPRNRGTNTTVLSSMSLEGMGPYMAVEGSTTKEVFETYVEHFLVPALREGQVVVMDNLSAHKGERVRNLIEDRGCGLLYLPPYSPDTTPLKKRSRRSSSCGEIHAFVGEDFVVTVRHGEAPPLSEVRRQLEEVDEVPV